MVTVKQLIEELQKQDPGRVVILQKDSEGNGYSPLAALEPLSYLAETTWSGEVGLEVLTDALREDGYGEEDVLDGMPALVLFPVN